MAGKEITLLTRTFRIKKRGDNAFVLFWVHPMTNTLGLWDEELLLAPSPLNTVLRFIAECSYRIGEADAKFVDMEADGGMILEVTVTAPRWRSCYTYLRQFAA